MLGMAVGLGAQWSMMEKVVLPSGFTWDVARFPVSVTRTAGRFQSNLSPRDLVNPAIWTGAAIHVDGKGGDDANSGLAAQDGDFSAAKRTIHAAFAAGNATAAPYRVIVQPGDYEESAFTRNGNDEPDQPVAILGWGGRVRYRTGPWSIGWSADLGGTFSTNVSAVRRAFRTDQLTPEGLYTELSQTADLATCEATPNSWCLVGGTTHVKTSGAIGAGDIALIRSFHGARFLHHADDLYLENIHCEGGITGALHVDASASRNVVGVNCSFRYSAPSNPLAPKDAVQVRRTNGLVAFFGCDASYGAEDGWSFHEDGTPGLHVLMQDCTGHFNGAGQASSANALTGHDAMRMIDLNGRYGLSRNGTELHCIQNTQIWCAGTSVVARDTDGTSVAFKCSNQSKMWLQDTTADAAGAARNYAIEANAGSVYTRGHTNLAGTVETSSSGSISGF